MKQKTVTGRRSAACVDIPDSDVVSTCTRLRELRKSLVQARVNAAYGEDVDEALDVADLQLCRLLQRLEPREGKP